MKISSLARQSTLVALLALLWPLSARSQTSPDLTPPDPSAPAAPTGEALLALGFDNDVTGIASSQTADKILVARDTKEWKSGTGALNWNYALGGESAPRLSIDASAVAPNAPASIKLDGARSVRFWLKTGAPGAVAVFFEEAQAPNDKNEPVRYVATVWSAGGDWTQYDVSRDRFAPEVNAADEANGALPVLDWTRIARFGVQDTTNTWLKASGQVRLKGARRLWLDDFQVSTGEAANAPITVAEINPLPQPALAPAPATPDAAPAPDAPAPDAPPDATENAPAADNGATMLPGEGGQDGDVAGDENALDDGANGADNANGGNEGDGGAEPAAPPLRVSQDDRGDARVWIPINASTESTTDGLKLSYIRLANRVTAIIGPVNPLWMKQFPLGMVRAGEKTGGPKLLLMFEVKTQKPTRLNVAVVERGGATYSKTVAIAPRAFRQRIAVPLSSLVAERTRPDKNGQIDLERIQSVVLSDVGAENGIAGPNTITLFSATWMY